MKIERSIPPSPREVVDRARKDHPTVYLIAYRGEENINPDYPKPTGKANRGPTKLEIIVSTLVVNVIFWGAVWLLWRWVFG
jgi:hypothetical protein